MSEKEKSQELICINCPAGCVLTAEKTEDGLKISGNQCGRGKEYAMQELTAPTRVLTALMRASNRTQPVSVKTDRPVPKEMLFTCVHEIYRIHPQAPIHAGDVLAEDLCGTGCRVLATRDCR